MYIVFYNFMEVGSPSWAVAMSVTSCFLFLVPSDGVVKPGLKSRIDAVPCGKDELPGL